MPGNTSPKLVVEERDGYVYVLYGGNPITLEMLVATINSVSNVIRTSGLDRVLIVRDAPLLDSDANRAMVADLINRSVGPNVRFAIVDIYGNSAKDVGHAAEACRLAGWDLTDFATIDEAEEWLTGPASRR